VVGGKGGERRVVGLLLSSKEYYRGPEKFGFQVLIVGFVCDARQARWLPGRAQPPHCGGPVPAPAGRGQLVV
jgi:hypothetical protein